MMQWCWMSFVAWTALGTIWVHDWYQANVPCFGQNSSLKNEGNTSTRSRPLENIHAMISNFQHPDSCNFNFKHAIAQVFSIPYNLTAWDVDLPANCPTLLDVVTHTPVTLNARSLCKPVFWHALWDPLFHSIITTLPKYHYFHSFLLQ